MEENFIEAIKNNILGTNNVIELSQKYKEEMEKTNANNSNNK